jgi:hypothetical protein
MKVILIGKIDKWWTKLNLISLIILLFLFRTANPLFKYPFIVLYLCMIIYLIFYYKEHIISNLKKFILNYSIILFLFIILLIFFFFSDKLYLTIFKDVSSALVLFSIFYMLSFLISSKEEFKSLINSILYLIVFFAFIIALTNILDLFDIISLHKYIFTNDISGNYPSYSEYFDYNFALLPILFGVIIVFYLLARTRSDLKKIFFTFLLTVFTMSILFSGSKRGGIILIGIFLILAIARIIYIFKKNNLLKNLSLNFRYLFLALIVLSLISFIFIHLFPPAFKLKTLKYIGCKNILTARIKIASNVMRYVSIFDKEIMYPDLYEKIWSIRLFDPNEPESGWGTRVHKTIYPLTGVNVEIIPQGVKGYLMDSTCNASSWSGNSYSFTKFGSQDLAQGKFGKASVFCYVSKDFNGDWVLLSLESRKGFLESAKYDLNRKNTWQKLEINVKKNKDNLTLNMYFSKMGVTDFTSLKGNVIFAYPQFEVFNEDESSILSLVVPLLNPGSQIDYYSLNKTSQISIFNDSVKFIPVQKENTISSVFNLSFLFSISKITPNSDRDPVRNWISNLISEDTTYCGYKAIINIDTIPNNLINLRISHWQFALQIFTKEYNWRKKIFGGGFNFLNWYGYYFMKDKTASDWPHNPFLSILLYSGLLGLLIYCFFLYKVFYYYLKYIREYPLLFIFFIITFFFTFFSGGSPFDPPIFGFFSILPFFIHSVHNNDKSETVHITNVLL